MRPTAAIVVAVAGLMGAGSARAQETAASGMRLAPSGVTSAMGRVTWSFGKPGPHIRDAGRRSLYGFVGGGIFMVIGLGVNALNASQCGARTICSMDNPVQAGIGFAFLGAVAGASGPQFSSKCTRSGRAILGIVGAAVGVTVAAAASGSPLMNAHSTDKATVKTMGTGLLGLGLGSGVVTAIC